MPEPRRGIRLGIDVGSVRVGVARSDPSALLATPVETVPRTPTDDGSSRIAELAAEYEVLEVVVGLPRSLSGAEGKAAGLARDYAEVLARILDVPVRLVDERLTTVSAHQALHHSGRHGRAHREVVDQVAAVLILQSALDSERLTGRGAGELINTGALDIEENP